MSAGLGYGTMEALANPLSALRTLHVGPFYLWTNLPEEAFAAVPRERKFWGAYKMRLSGQDRARAGRERGAIPQVLAKAVTDWAETHP